MPVFRVSVYENEEDYQLGHCLRSIPFRDFSEAKHHFESTIEYPRCIIGMTFQNNPEYEGFIGTYCTSVEERKPGLTINDFWLYPDPNYRGEKDNQFWGTVVDYHKTKESERGR